MLIGKHAYLSEKDVTTGWNVKGDTGYYTLKKISLPMDDEKGYSREINSFVAGKAGTYIIYYGVEFKKNDGTNHYEYLSATITVQTP